MLLRWVCCLSSTEVKAATVPETTGDYLSGTEWTSRMVWMSCQHGEGFPQGTLVSLQQLPLDDFRLKAVVVGALMTLLTQRILVFSNICWMIFV